MLCFGSSASSTAPNRTDTGFVDLEKFPEGTLAVEMTPIEYGSHGSIRIIATPTNPEHPTRLQYTAKYWTLIAGDIAHVPALESVLDRGDNTWTLYPVGRPAHPKQSGGESSSPAMSFMAGLSSLLTTGIASVGKNVRVEVTVEVPAALLVNSGVMPQYASRVIGTNHSIEYAVIDAAQQHAWRSVTVSTTNSAITFPAMHLTGDLVATTTNGAVSTTGAVSVTDGGNISVRTTNGSVTFGAPIVASDGSVAVTTTNGAIRAHASVQASSAVTVRTTNAAVNMDRIVVSHEGSAEVQSSNGSISVGLASASISPKSLLAVAEEGASSSSSENKVRLTVRTTNGRAAVHVARGLGFHWDARTSNGSVMVQGTKTKAASGVVPGSDGRVDASVSLTSTNGSLAITDDLSMAN